MNELLIVSLVLLITSTAAAIVFAAAWLTGVRREISRLFRDNSDLEHRVHLLEGDVNSLRSRV